MNTAVRHLRNEVLIIDYSITWAYIVEQMKEKYSIPADSQDKYSMAEIERYISLIWTEYFNSLLEKDEDFKDLVK